MSRRDRPPAWAGAMLERLLPPSHGPQVRAELDEEYERFVRPSRGPFRARLWYWRQALGSLLWQLRHRTRRSSPSRGFALDSLLKDMRFAVRSFRGEPMFTLVVLATVALGIGATTLVFTVLNAVLLRPLPYPEPERLVRLWSRWNVSKDVTEQVIDGTDSFAALAGVIPDRQALAGHGEPVELTGAAVTVGYFPLTGAQLELGRAFLAEESETDAEPVVILAYGLWRQTFAGDPGILGTEIDLGGVRRTVVGIMSPDHRPLVRHAEYWVPVTFDRSDFSGYTGTAQVLVYGRLAAGVGLERAAADVHAVAARVQEGAPDAFGDDWVAAASPVRLHGVLVASSRLGLWTVMGAVSCLLLIACANVANLLLARATRRQREMAIRMGLGAGPVRLTRQLLTESLILGLVGGTCGILLSITLLDVLRSLLPASLPLADGIAMDTTVAGFALVASIATSVLFGLVPALRAARVDPQARLREATSAASVGRHGLRVNRLFVTAEIALAVVLVVGAGLMLRSLRELARIDPGFRAERVLTMRVRLPSSSRYQDGEQRLAYYRALQERVSKAPGVDALGLVAFLPMATGQWSAIYKVDGVDYPPDQPPPNARVQFVYGDYFRAMGIRLLRGRGFTGEDRADGPVVGIINETLAREAFGDEDPLDRTITMFGGTDLRVVGVVADTRQSSPAEPAAAEAFLSYEQIPWLPSMFLVARSSTGARLDPATLRQAIWQVDPDIPVSDVREMTEVVAAAAADSRFLTRLLAAFAALALMLGAIGVYGVMSYAVGERTYEFGIRMALGASRADIQRRALLGALGPAVLGVTVGTAAALALSGSLRGLLFGIQARDPLTFATVPALMLAVALLATYLPSRRAARVDPRLSLGV